LEFFGEEFVGISLARKEILSRNSCQKLELILSANSSALKILLL
jgi:hypothetical protein